MKKKTLESHSESAKTLSGPPGTGPLGSRRGPRRHMPAAERREQILRAALLCFGEKGYHAATMDDLARASGLSKGSLYLHFRSKEDVFLALVDVFAGDFYGEWDAAAASDEDAVEILWRVFEISVQSFSRERVFLLAWAEFLSHPAARERMREAYTTARMRIETIVEQGRRAGSLQSGPPTALVAGSLVGAIEGLLLQWLVDPDFDLKAHVDVVWEILMKGLRT